MREKLLVPVLAAGLLVGCSHESATPPQLTPTTSHTTTSGEQSQEDKRHQLEQAGYKKVDHNLYIANYGNQAYLQLQHKVGTAVIDNLVKAGPIDSVVDGVHRQVTFSMPNPEIIRAYAFVPTNLDIPKVMGDPKITHAYTMQGIDTQTSKLQGAFGAIPQEPDTFLRDTGVEYCQGLDMQPADGTFSPNDNGVEYNKRKEAVCNTAGVAGDQAFIDGNYDTYKQRVEGRTLQGEAAHNSDIPFPVLSQSVFADLTKTVK